MDRMARRVRRVRRAKIAMVVVSGVLAAMTVVFAIWFCVLHLGGNVPMATFSEGSFMLEWAANTRNPAAVLMGQSEIFRMRVLPTWMVHCDSTGIPGYVLVRMPLIYVLAASLGSVWLLHRRERAARPLLGMCPNCSYDLRGSAGDVCPECGAKKGPRAEPTG